MILVALRNLAGRKLRAALTALAIVLGVAMVSGTYVLTDTIDKAFTTIFEDSYAGTDAVVTGPSADINFQGLSATAAPVPESLLEQVRAVEGVDVAAGGVVDELATKLIDKDGKAFDTQGSPALGFGIDTSSELSRFNPLNLIEGRWPSGSGEVAIDVSTADKLEFEVGDRIKVATLQPVREFTLVGLARFGQVESLGTATVTVFDLPTAQALLDREGQYDGISVSAAEGVTPEELVANLRAALPADVDVKTGTEQAGEDSDEVSEFVSFIRYFLLAFAGVALFVGAFVIFNTLSITVAQRTREFATLRTIGASRRQLLASVIVEALVLGVLASVAGLFLGFALAAGLNALFVALELDLPTAAAVYAPRTIVVSVLLGVVVTLVAGVFPAVRATRVPPIAAVREGAILPRSRLAPFAPWIAAVIILVSLGLLAYAMFVDELGTAQRLLSIAAGVLGLFVGVAMLSHLAVPRVADLMGPAARFVLPVLLVLAYPLTLAYWLLRHAAFSTGAAALRRGLALLGGLGLLAGIAVLLFFVVPAFAALTFLVALVVLAMWVRARVTSWTPEWPVEFPNVRLDGTANALGKENTRRNPSRTASTAAALMIGLALVTFIGVLSDGMKASNREAIENQVLADYLVVSQSGFQPFVAAAGDAVADSPAAGLATSVRADLAQFAGKDGYLTGIEPDTIAQAYRFDWVDGSDAVLADLGTRGAIVDDDLAEEKDLAVGDTFQLLVPSGERVQLEVKGIYAPPPFYPLLGNVSVDKDTFDSLYDRPRNQYTFVNVEGDPTPASQTALERALADFPDAEVQTRTAWIDQQDADFNQFLIMLYVLLALSVIVSLFGMVNTLVLSVFERTRELGMLRAVGMTRRQVRRMIRHESVITALIGAALGLPLGIFLAALVTRALSQFDVQFSVPVPLLIAFAVIAMIAGVLAAIAPARRAARLRILEALQYE